MSRACGGLDSYTLRYGLTATLLARPHFFAHTTPAHTTPHHAHTHAHADKVTPRLTALAFLLLRVLTIPVLIILVLTILVLIIPLLTILVLTI